MIEVNSENAQKTGYFLGWIHDRLSHVFKDDVNADWMVRLQKYVDKIKKEEEDEMDKSKKVMLPVQPKKVTIYRPPVINDYVIVIKVLDSNNTGMFTEIRSSYFKSDFPLVRFWDEVMILGKKWSKMKRHISLQHSTGKEIQSCILCPKVD